MRLRELDDVVGHAPAAQVRSRQLVARPGPLEAIEHRVGVLQLNELEVVRQRAARQATDVQLAAFAVTHHTVALAAFHGPRRKRLSALSLPRTSEAGVQVDPHVQSVHARFELQLRRGGGPAQHHAGAVAVLRLPPCNERAQAGLQLGHQRMHGRHHLVGRKREASVHGVGLGVRDELAARGSCTDFRCHCQPAFQRKRFICLSGSKKLGSLYYNKNIVFCQTPLLDPLSAADQIISLRLHAISYYDSPSKSFQ